MITLITAIPGGGKTALAVSMMLEEGNNRPIFQMGIPDLKVDHSPVPPISEWTRLEPTPQDTSLLVPVFTFPENSIVVIDEAQNVYRPRASGSKVPDIVKAFETHRHLGIDFWLITQKPSLIDANIRALVGRHVHLRNTYLGRKLYESREYFNVDDKTALNSVPSRSFKLPKKVFSLYTSSSLHIKQKFRIPLQFYYLLVIALILGYIGWSFYHRYHQVVNPVPVAQKAMAGAGAGPTKEGAGLSAPQSYLASVVPQVDGLDFTAPRYADVTKPVRAPVPSACVRMGADCRCYTDQATRLNVPRELCVQIVKNGFYVDFEIDSTRSRQDLNRQAPVSPGAVPLSSVRAESGPSSVNLSLPPRDDDSRSVVSRQISG